MSRVTLVGCGFVADLYVRSLAKYPEVRVLGAHDRDKDRMEAFRAHWKIAKLPTMDAVFSAMPRDGMILNLTNPGEHHAVNRACLEAGFHVWSEKPLAVTMEQARDLHDLAQARGLQLASAPCSVLGEAAQTMAHAVAAGTAGLPRLVYAELDDGFIPQAPLDTWISESGAPWPYVDEFRVSCTLEHAGYYLSWLIAMFGPVRTVVAASVIPDKRGVTDAAPDVSVGTLFFHSGMVVRLTCSIVAPHDHRIRVVVDDGVLEMSKAWDNAARLTYRRLLRIRRRLLESTLGKRIKLKGPTHPMVGRRGAASMNFALGPVEMLEAIAAGRACRLGGDYALHQNEVTLAIQNAGETTGAQVVQTSCAMLEPMPWAR